MAQAKPIPASDFDLRATLLSRSAAADAFGQQTITWTSVATVWARRRPARSAERVDGGPQIVAHHDVEFTIRHSTTVAPVAETWRLECAGRAYDVVGVMPIGRNQYINLQCLEGIKDGR